ncbi:branched chain amino acid ABC transporter substrate-binding protein [Brevibacillus reuszeri]|uniref:ABC transporter substrate-binding protein n=1 Tax=Brevibacillus reuszeri TaxID=54915 RepID=A0A0K9Z0C2_9BACL|nr:branched-chain amino acid ABC transporter substrate-binding protein [Brevibacillus reuszeri]KNB74351.1 ABC transporter substrate-binding protein [Brevibacillus reuszeri]MED1856253.1 branched-chain amino acid ABC transporter substrate-binding protein [Brevibacillus reuszeri]GED68058.1 branched chain amino acid ABC transporter substrate-binding protein [Brevibacillus reuszeri]
MSLFKKKAIIFSALLATLSLSACNSQSVEQKNATGSDAAAGGTKILIATQSPLSGSQSAIGDSIKTGAEYALNLQKEEFKQLGFDLQLTPQDDQADPKIGVSNAEMLAANPDVLGVVGHFNTGVAIPSSVKYETAKLVMVSPANSGVKLTEEGKKSVHRICARDDAQGPKGAKYAKDKLGVKTVFLIHDKTAYGQGLVDEVKAQFERDGVQVLGYEGVTQGEKDYNFVVNNVVSKNPDMLYFGGIYPEAGIIVKQAREKGFKGLFMGGDGIDSSDLIKIAGPAAEGIYFTSLAGDVKQNDDGKKWAEEYEKAMGKKAETYSVYAFDSMNIILNGVKEAIKANGGKKPTREQVLDLVHQTKDFKGRFVNVTFDDKGDNVFADVFVYQYTTDSTKFLGKIE